MTLMFRTSPRSRLPIVLAIAGTLSLAPFVSPMGLASYEEPGEPIDLVIALDVSGTMKPLIDSARVKLWEVINDLATAEPTPSLRVALLTYGNQTGTPASGWVRVESDLTADLDLISERLFALRSRGAEEYVGRVIKTAIEELSWSDSSQALRFLFVAGNEPADQDDDFDFRRMSEAARSEGIVLSAVFCGRPEHRDASSWREMAELAQGEFAAIDHRGPVWVESSPVDGELAELGALLNDTYVPLGKEGKARKKSRAKQDDNARRLGPAVAATRAQTKATPLFASNWDLVDAVQAGRVDLATLDERELPRSLRGMTAEERQIFVDEMRELRDELRLRIAALGIERQRTISEKLAAAGYNAAPSRSFDQVLRRTIRERAQEKGFLFPEE